MKKKSSAKPSHAVRNKIKRQYQSWVSCYGSKRVRVTARPLVGGSSGLIKAVIFSVSDVNLVARRKKEPSPHYSEMVRNSVLAADLRMAINSAKQKLKTQSDDHALTFIAQQFLCAMEFRRFNRANRAAKFKPKNRTDFKTILNVKNLVSWWRAVSSGAENISFSWVKLRVPTIPAMANVSAYKPRRKYALWLLEGGISPIKKKSRVRNAMPRTVEQRKSEPLASEDSIPAGSTSGNLKKIPSGRVIITIRGVSILADEDLSQVIWYFHTNHFDDPSRAAVQARVLEKLKVQGLIVSQSKKFSDAFKRSFERIVSEARSAGVDVSRHDIFIEHNSRYYLNPEIKIEGNFPR